MDAVAQTALWMAAARAGESRRSDRLFDDDLLRATEIFGIHQVVMLAAGMDARAYRLCWPQGIAIYEMDCPGLLELKEAILTRESAILRCERKPLGVDLARDWASALLDARFRCEEPSVWLAEGTLSYLNEPAVHTLLGQVTDLAAFGSRLAVDTVNAVYLTSKWTANTLQRFAQLDRKGLEPAASHRDSSRAVRRMGLEPEVPAIAAAAPIRQNRVV